jgi:hypothetical protein
VRGIRASALLVLVFVGLVGVQPPCVLACSCPEPPPLAEAARDPNTAVVAGRVGLAVQGGHAFVVERWFNGPDPAPTFLARSGNGADCGVPLQTGDHLLAVWYRDEQGAYSASSCSRFAWLDAPDGEALMAEATEAFGAGIVVNEPTPGPIDVPGGPAGLPPEAIAVGAVVAGVGVLAAVAGVALIARRRRAGA